MSDSPVTRRRAITGAATLAVSAAMAGCSSLVGGDTNRPPEAQGHSYINFDEWGSDSALVKFNDKWWWLHTESAELELIGEDTQ